jgi:hypothetical protein
MFLSNESQVIRPHNEVRPDGKPPPVALFWIAGPHGKMPLSLET